MLKIISKQVSTSLLYLLLSKRQLLKTALSLANIGNISIAEVTFSHDQAGSITIKWTSEGVDYGSNTDAENAFKEYVPNYTSIKLKSQKWGGDPTVVLKTDADGAVKISEVKPAAFKEYLGDATTATDDKKDGN